MTEFRIPVRDKIPGRLELEDLQVDMEPEMRREPALDGGDGAGEARRRHVAGAWRQNAARVQEAGRRRAVRPPPHSLLFRQEGGRDTLRLRQCQKDAVTMEDLTDQGERRGEALAAAL